MAPFVFFLIEPVVKEMTPLPKMGKVEFLEVFSWLYEEIPFNVAV